jgi:large subunit ribosomal protein L10
MPEKNHPKAHVSEEKKKLVADLINLIKEYPIIGAINMESLPAPQLQKMKEQLRSSVVIFMAKRRLMKIAIEHCKDKKKGIEKIEPYLKGMPALLFTKENPFKLYNALEKNKSPAPAKAGQTAPKDIIIPAGATPFAPGPVISELSAIGLKTGVENGKVVIKADTVVCQEGQLINPAVASILARLDIKPMEIGLNITGIFEDGIIYGKNVLLIDEKVFMQSLYDAVRWAMNLSVETGYTCKDNINLFIAKAFREAKAVALEGNIMADLVAKDIIEKAERQMLSLKNTAKV